MAVKVRRRLRATLLNRVIDTVQEQQLFIPGQHLLVAVSGGPDSVALLSLLASMAPDWRLTLTAVHFNYGLRGSESDGDEAFVSTLCRERGIALLIRRPTLVKERRQSSLQALARDARYAAMKSITYEIGADRIVVGHTANDQAETMLMWMLRGAGLTGLAGMPFIREALIVRPLLAVSRKEILDYLRQEGLQYRRDSSNESVRFRRNRIRRELVPVMEQIAPATVRLLQRQANLLREDERYLEQVARDLYASLVKQDAGGGQRFDRQTFLAIPVALQRRIVRMVLRVGDPKGRASSAQSVEAVQRFFLTAVQGARMLLRQFELTREGDVIRIDRQEPQRSGRVTGAADVKQEEILMTIPSTVYWPGTKQKIHVQVMRRQAAESLLRSSAADCAVFDADRLSEPLAVRNWRAGDRFCPRGMKGKRKKLQDFFTDLKVGRQERKQVPLLVAPEGILWVVGWRQDERFLVRGSSVRCLVATVKPGLVRD
ncbi:MAG TPA: tRNA lysidine(34) synthetase TilS [Nitrospira sp.]|nr:tRNA lysidine(34) synthetase TilS [Nitrospira sp.]